MGSLQDPPNDKGRPRRTAPCALGNRPRLLEATDQLLKAAFQIAVTGVDSRCGHIVLKGLQ